jgi:DNA-binding LacI/PurR family transcriptional regulator
MLQPKIKTMEEFSVASGISRATVSKYFNDPDSVRPTTRQRIEKAAKKLRYRPNLFAVNFNRKNPKTLGMIVPSLTDPFFAGLVERVELRAMANVRWKSAQSKRFCR